MNAPVHGRPTTTDAETEARIRRLQEIAMRPQSSDYGDLGRRRSTGDASEKFAKTSTQINNTSRWPPVKYASLSDGENSGYEDSDSEDCMESHSLELDGGNSRRVSKKTGYKGRKSANKTRTKGESRRFSYEHDGPYNEDRGQSGSAPHQNGSNAGEAEELRKKVAKEKLRIAGQLQTIRTLEVKLSQAEHGVKERDLEISSLRSKLQQAEKRELALGGRPIPSTVPAAVTRIYCNPVAPKLSTTPNKVEEREAIRKLKV
jgi:hypothetical protein